MARYHTNRRNRRRNTWWLKKQMTNQAMSRTWSWLSKLSSSLLLRGSRRTHTRTWGGGGLAKKRKSERERHRQLPPLSSQPRPRPETRSPPPKCIYIYSTKTTTLLFIHSTRRYVLDCSEARNYSTGVLAAIQGLGFSPPNAIRQTTHSCLGSPPL